MVMVVCRFSQDKEIGDQGASYVKPFEGQKEEEKV